MDLRAEDREKDSKCKSTECWVKVEKKVSLSFPSHPSSPYKESLAEVSEEVPR